MNTKTQTQTSASSTSRNLIRDSKGRFTSSVNVAQHFGVGRNSRGQFVSKSVKTVQPANKVVTSTRVLNRDAKGRFVGKPVEDLAVNHTSSAIASMKVVKKTILNVVFKNRPNTTYKFRVSKRTLETLRNANSLGPIFNKILKGKQVSKTVTY